MGLVRKQGRGVGLKLILSWLTAGGERHLLFAVLTILSPSRSEAPSGCGLQLPVCSSWPSAHC